jgi:hypothetical protein
MARTTIRSEDITAGQVKAADLASDAVDTTGIQNDIAILGFKVAANGSLAKYNLVDQTIDDFQDASGVDASGSTNELRNDSNYYGGTTAISATISGNYDSTGTDGSYSWYKWTTATSSGTYTTDVAQQYEYLVIAGGGGGGTDVGAWAGGGGGAGGYRTATGFNVAATTISSITVGAGGAADTSGADSVFSTITSTGGGAGGTKDDDGNDGGSGGGGGATASGGAGNTPSTSPVQGYGGGTGSYTVAGRYAGGGGGGASEAGVNSNAQTDWSDGGDGITSSIDGTALYRSGGGGGGKSNGSDTSSNNGGLGGGGNGGDRGAGTDPTAGTANSGGGGGGGYYRTQNGESYAGGVGGSGIVIIRRLTSTVPYGNMTLVSTTTTAQAAPTKGDIVFTYTNGAGTTVLGTDLTAEYSADGGSTWTSMTLGSEGTTGGHNIATAHDVTLTSTSGTSMAYRIKTLNQSAAKTTRIQAVSLGWS